MEPLHFSRSLRMSRSREPFSSHAPGSASRPFRTVLDPKVLMEQMAQIALVSFMFINTFGKPETMEAGQGCRLPLLMSAAFLQGKNLKFQKWLIFITDWRMAPTRVAWWMVLFAYSFILHITLMGWKRARKMCNQTQNTPNATDGNHKNLMIPFQIMISLDYGSLTLYYATFYSNYTVLRLMNLT